jgi:hypothetical protein
MTTIVRSVNTESEEKRLKAYKEDSKLVRGKFLCHEPKGGQVKFPFRKYKEDKTVQYTMKDGEVYQVPLAVAKHLNNCGWEVHSHLLDAQGNPYVGTGKIERRFSFQSLDFV